MTMNCFEVKYQAAGEFIHCFKNNEEKLSALNYLLCLQLGLEIDIYLLCLQLRHKIENYPPCLQLRLKIYNYLPCLQLKLKIYNYLPCLQLRHKIDNYLPCYPLANEVAKGYNNASVRLSCNILVNTRINILQWILTKLGTYLSRIIQRPLSAIATVEGLNSPRVKNPYCPFSQGYALKPQ